MPEDVLEGRITGLLIRSECNPQQRVGIKPDY